MEEGLSTPVGTRRSFFVKVTMLIFVCHRFLFSRAYCGLHGLTSASPSTQDLDFGGKNQGYPGQ